MTTVIYALRCPVSGAIRYVGKTENARRRLKAHLGCRNKRHPRDRWIKSLKDRDLAPSMEIIRTVADGEDWAQAEREEIAKGFAAGWPLFNITLGGEGTPLGPEGREARSRRMRDPETRARMSAAAKARWADPVKRAAALAANSDPDKRRRLAEKAKKRATQEYRAAMSAKSRAAWSTPEKRARIVAGITPEVRTAVADAAREMWKADPDRAARMKRRPDTKSMWARGDYREAQAHARSSPDYKEKMSRAQREAWERRRQKR